MFFKIFLFIISLALSVQTEDKNDSPLMLIEMRPNQTIVHDLYSKVAGSAYASRLLHEALAVQSQVSSEKLVLQLVSKNQAPFGGYFKNGVIGISDALSPSEKLSTFLFELTNATMQNEFQKIDDAAEQGLFHSADEYARAFESIEYSGTIKHHEIIMACISKEGWDPSMDNYRGAWDSFEGYILAQKQCGHFKHYEMRFNQLYNRT